MDRIISYTATRTTKTKKTSSLVAHSVILANQAGRSDMLEPTTLVLLLTNMAVQTFVRLESPSKGSPFTDAMISSPALAVTTLVLTGAPACFLLTSLVVPRLHKQQQQGLEAYSASMWTDLYMFAHVANFFVCTPLIVGLLASSVLVQICGLSYPGDNLVSHTVYGASAIFGLALMAFFVSFYLGAFRPRDCFSCTSRTPPLIQAVTLFLAVASERVKDHIDDEAGVARLALILLTLVQLVWVVPGLLVGAIYTSFHSQKYRLLTLLGMILTIYNLILDGTLLAKVKPPHGLAITSCLMIILLSSWFLWNQSRTFSLSNKPIDSISFQSLATMENQLWNQSLGSTLTASQAVLGMLAEGLHKSKHLTNFQKRKVQNDGPRGHHEHMTLFANYLFDLYFAKYNNKQQTMDIEWAFSFAYFLLRWKKQVYLLMALHRSLNSATLSLRHSVSLAVLEAAITRQLQTQDAQFSYFFSESSGSQNTQTKTKSARLDIYHIIDTVSAFERLVDQMRIQLRLQSQFLTAVESRSQPVAAVHSAVAVITEQRSVCKQLFDELHAAADSAQTFHLLPFAFFLEHTENNLERRVELVKTYYFKSQVRRVHGRLFNELVDESVTLVSESDRSKLGQITHSSKNAALIFGADDVGALEGRSLDLFFHAEMAAAHRRQMREYLQHFDRPYLGDERERYVTLGNGVYYRVECVTKFVPHLREGFQFVTKLKHLGEDEGKYGKMDSTCIHIALNDKLNIVGIGYSQSLVKNGLLSNHKLNKNDFSGEGTKAETRRPNILDLVGKPLNHLSPDIEQAVADRFAEVHSQEAAEAAEAQEKQYEKLKQNGDVQVVAESGALDIPAKGEENHPTKASSLEVSDERGDMILESGNFLARYDKMINLGLEAPQGFNSDSDTQSVVANFDTERTYSQRMAILLNFSHFCWKSYWAAEDKETLDYSMRSNSKYSIRTQTESQNKRTSTMVAGFIDGNLGNGSAIPVHAGLTILRFKSPKLADLETHNSIAKARSSIQDSQIALDELVEFDPFSLLKNFIAKEIINKALLDLKPLESQPRYLKSGDEGMRNLDAHRGPRASVFRGFSDTRELGQKNESPQADLQSQAQLSQLALFTSRNNLSPTTQRSSGIRPQSRRAQMRDSSRELSRSGSDEEPDNQTNRLGSRHVSLGFASMLRGKTNTTDGPEHAKRSTDPLTGHLAENPPLISKVQDKKILKQQIVKRHKKQKAELKKEQEPFQGSKKAPTREMALSVSGASSTASQTSEINTNRLIMSMIRYPTVNRSSKIIVVCCAVLFWTYCHIYQSRMEAAYISEFEGMGHLQNLFGVFINFDSYVKAAGNNLIERQLTKEKGFDPARYNSFNPKIADVVKTAQKQFHRHIEGAYETQLDMIGNLTLLTQAEVERFMRDSRSWLDISIPTLPASAQNVTLGPYYLNVLEKALMVLYDLRVWNEDPVTMGSWAANRYFLDAIESWSRLVARLTTSFDTSYKAKVLDLEKISLGTSISGVCALQIFLLIIFWQSNTIRKSIMMIVNVVQFIKREEVEFKLQKLQLLEEYFGDTLYIGSQGKEAMTPTVHKLHFNSRNNRDAYRSDKVSSRQSLKRSFKDADTSSSNSTMWFGMGGWLLLLALSMQLQSGVNLLTAARQRAVAADYLEWLHINEDYYLFVFHLNNFPSAIYLDNAAKVGLFRPVEQLTSGGVYEYGESVGQAAKRFVRDLQGKQAVASTFGYQKFFQNPCDLIDLSVYDLPKESCNMLNSGVIKDGYIRFIDVDRLTIERLQNIYAREASGELGLTSKSDAFLAVAFHRKNIHQLLFPLIHEDLLEAAARFQNNTQAFFEFYGLIVQISLTALAVVILTIWKFVADAKLSTAVSTYLLLPAESLATNPYVRAQLKQLKAQGK